MVTKFWTLKTANQSTPVLSISLKMTQTMCITFPHSRIPQTTFSIQMILLNSIIMNRNLIN